MLALGEDIAAQIFRELSKKEVNKIGLALQRLGRVEQDVIDQVVLEFREQLDKPAPMYGDANFAQRLIQKAFRESEGDNYAQHVGLDHQPRLESLDKFEPMQLASYLRNEHLQTIAIVLAHLNAKACAETLEHIPECLHAEILMRIANLDPVDSEVLMDIEDALRAEAESMGSVAKLKVGGVDTLVHMLGGLDSDGQARMLDQLEERDPSLAEKVREQLFTFEDLIQINNRDVQTLIKAIPNETLLLALKSAPDIVREHIFSNMSQRAADLLSEDIAAMPKARKSDVEEAQRQIVRRARELEAAGEISIRDTEQYV